MKLAITLFALVAACSADAGIYLPHGATHNGLSYPSHYGYATDDFPIAPVAAPLPVARFSVHPRPVVSKFAARIAHVAPVVEVRTAPIAAPIAHIRASPIAAPIAQVRASPIAAAVPIVAPIAEVRAAPIAAVRTAPVVATGATRSQYHSQDEAGNFAFGYQNINSARQESGNIHTGLAGSYSDYKGTINYVADNAGFRITN